MHVEQGLPVAVVCQETGVSHASLSKWVRIYKRDGEGGLNFPPRPGRGAVLPAAIKDKIIDLKKSEPASGVRRISQTLRRLFFLPASPETVRRTLAKEGLNNPPTRKRTHNPSRPRFFERSTPNQLWQTDIFTFRLGGNNAYLIGFIDDFSRYIVGMDLFRSQTADNLIEVFRQAKAEYNPPKDMLTDNGRQYTNWHGTSRFEAELKKDRIIHIKSAPHHPQTLGKIERFWKTIFEEYLIRVQFASFEEARERVRLWIRYYNHRRPHQGIGGLCPADRYFEIQTQMRKTIEAGIQENLLEIALRGKPQSPFYMVGRMEGQTVMLRAEKGKVRLIVDDEKEKDKPGQEIVYNLESENADLQGAEHGKEQNLNQQQGEQGEITPAAALGDGQGKSGALGVDGEAETIGDLPGVADQMGSAAVLAGPGLGGNAAGFGAAQETGAEPGVEPAACGLAGEAPQPGAAGGQQTGATPPAAASAPEPGEETNKNGIKHESANAIKPITEAVDGITGCQGAGAHDGDHEGSQRGAVGDGWSGLVRSLAQDLLRMGEQGACGHDQGTGGSAHGPAGGVCGSGEGSLAAPGQGSGRSALPGQTDHRGEEPLTCLRRAQG